MTFSLFNSARPIAIWFAILTAASAHAQQPSCESVFNTRSRTIFGLLVKKLDTQVASVKPVPTRDYKRLEPNENPLLDYTRVAFDAVDFSRLKPEHFLPALDMAIAQSKLRLAAIRENSAPPTFENTIEALELFDAPLERISFILAHMIGVKGSDQLREISKELYVRSHALDQEMEGDPVLQARVEEFVRANVGGKITKEQARLLSRIRGLFKRSSGPTEAEKKIDEINLKLNTLTAQFGAKLTKDRAAFRHVIQDPRDLEGLSDALIRTARERARNEGLSNAWSFTSGETDSIIALATRESVRKKAWIHRSRIGQKGSDSDNRSLVIEIAKLREERAKAAGLANASTYTMRGRMAQEPDVAIKFLTDLADKYRPLALKEKEELDAYAGHEVKPWDASFTVRRLKAERLGYEEKELTPYFPLNRVLDGFFFTAKKLYGVTFSPRRDIPTWDPSVMVYEIKDRHDNHVGMIYFDFFERPGEKRAGAWATTLERSGLVDGEAQRPLVVNVTNFKKPAHGEPALLTSNNVTTLFHEGGHGLHHLLSKTRYRIFSGTQVVKDFVELPSQFLENYAFQDDVLDVYARHYKTGRRIPAELVRKLKKAQTFRAATNGLAQVRMALLDLAWHTRDLSEVTNPGDVSKFEQEVLAPFLTSKTYGAMTSPTFSHIFSGAYESGYYSYKWADVLASDAFEAFEENGLFDSEAATKMRMSIMERGGTEPADKLYRDFRGRDADPEALLRREGLLPPLKRTVETRLDSAA
jgi:peptidyl-dipeptidase Dcp